VLKSDLKTCVERPHFNPSFLSPDFHNLSQGPHFEKSRWADHNQSRKDKFAVTGEHFTAFPQHPVHDDTFNETRRMKSAGRIPAVNEYEKMRSQTQQAYDHEEHMKKLAAYAKPTKKNNADAYKFDGLVESAGVPSNCSPYMYFQLR